MDHPGPQSSELCPKCLHELEPYSNFCKHCTAPVTVIATTSPYERILAEGFAYREASENPDRTIKLVGMWLIWGPILLAVLTFGGWMLATAIKVNDLLLSLFSIVYFGFFGWIAASLLLKTTRNWWRLRREANTPPVPTRTWREIFDRHDDKK
jgi:hypothetical protein